MRLFKASKILNNYMDKRGQVVRRPPDVLSTGTMFVERAALVEHLFFEAQRLEPQR